MRAELQLYNEIEGLLVEFTHIQKIGDGLYSERSGARGIHSNRQHAVDR